MMLYCVLRPLKLGLKNVFNRITVYIVQAPKDLKLVLSSLVELQRQEVSGSAMFRNVGEVSCFRLKTFRISVELSGKVSQYTIHVDLHSKAAT